MIRIQNFNFISGKFLQLPKFWKFRGGKCPKYLPWLRACLTSNVFPWKESSLLAEPKQHCWQPNRRSLAQQEFPLDQVHRTNC